MPTWGGTNTPRWRPPAVRPVAAPKPATPTAPVSAPAPLQPGRTIQIVPGPMMAPKTRPIVIAPPGKSKHKCAGVEPTHEPTDNVKREKPAKPPKPTLKYPWELWRDFFIARAARTKPADFVSTRATRGTPLVVPAPQPKPMTINDEHDDDRLVRPIITRDPIPDELAPGEHVFTFHNPAVFKPQDVDEYKARTVDEFNKRGVTVKAINIDGRVVTIKAVIPNVGA